MKIVAKEIRKDFILTIYIKSKMKLQDSAAVFNTHPVDIPKFFAHSFELSN